MSEDAVTRPVPTPPKQPLTQPVQVVAGRSSGKKRLSRRRRKHRLPDCPIVFVGPMAAGKTSLGRRVAKELGVPFVDTDVVFTRLHGPITDFFSEHGEAAFREIEADLIAAELSQPGTRIVALGGGAVITARTRDLLQKFPVVLLMTTQASVLRTANLDKRPLLRDDPEAWGRILESRRAFYEEVADITFRTDRATKEQLTRRVAQWARGRSVSTRYGRSTKNATRPASTPAAETPPEKDGSLRS